MHKTIALLAGSLASLHPLVASAGGVEFPDTGTEALARGCDEREE
jgi:hypothetical protein